MFEDLNDAPGSGRFRGQRLLTSLILLVLAAGMVAIGIKEIAAGRLFEDDLANSPAGAGLVRLILPGSGFEVQLAGTNLNEKGQLSGPGWLKSSPKPGEAGTAVIGINPDWPVAALKPGDRLEIDGLTGEKSVFEVVPAPSAEAAQIGQYVTLSSTTLKGLKLVVLAAEDKTPETVIWATLVQTN